VSSVRLLGLRELLNAIQHGTHALASRTGLGKIWGEYGNTWRIWGEYGENNMAIVAEKK